jgi:hypothetical protein
MISEFQPTYRLDDGYFREAKVIIERSHAAELIESFQDESTSGGREPTGILYSVKAVLVCALTLIMLGRTPSLKDILGAIGDLSVRQLAEVGMAGQDTSRIFAMPPEQTREYRRFTSWLNRRLAVLDSGPDQPARRIANSQHSQIINKRTTEQQRACRLAAQRMDTVINDIVAGSILDSTPTAARGDLLVDETIFDLAGSSAGLGAKPDKKRGAAYVGKYYARDEKTTVRADGRGKGKRGFGLGLTAVSMVGPPDQLHRVPAVIVAMDIHPPTSGSAEAVDKCLTHLKRNGLDKRPADGKTWPLMIVDMGYNRKRDFPHVMLKHQYSPVARYPKDWTLFEPSAHPPGAKEPTPPGPIQHAGAFYCPAAQSALSQLRVPRSRELLASGRWEEHDNRLSAALPFLMGTNSRPMVSGLRGRPALGVKRDVYVKQELVCPAVQLRVRCPLKPESMDTAGFGIPLAEPTWQADERICCRQSTMRLVLTERQLNRAQWRMVPGSWEHMLIFESGRAVTEQRFSLLKSPHITHLSEMKWGPRREPMIKLLLALAVAATNHEIQKKHATRPVRTNSIDIRWRQLTRYLGHEPTRTPPRT